MTRRILLESNTAAATVDLDAGGRLSSLSVGGVELLVTEGRSPLHWGCYPMAPWANRVRHGEFTFEDQAYRLPVTFDGHAIHGTVLDAPWEEDGPWITRALGPDWPFPGFARQRFSITEDGLSMRLEVHSEEGPMPASCGWHPWFITTIDDAELSFRFEADYMFEQSEDGIPTGARVPVPPGPWDNCFGGLGAAPVLEWGAAVRLTIESSCPCLVVYNREPQGHCIEPQTAPPNALNMEPAIVLPGEPLVATTSWTWEV